MTRGTRIRAAAGATAVGLALAGCAAGSTTDEGSAASTAGASDVRVVTSTTILGSVAGQVVACGGGEVETLMPVGADPHDYSPSSAEVAQMVSATLVVTSGLGLEEGLDAALATAEQDGAAVLQVGPELDPQPLADDPDSSDPHVWMDVSRMATAAQLIGDELAAVTGEEAYRDCGAEAASSLDQTDADVREILSVVPDESRILVVDHEAFGYFAQAYDFEVAGVVIPGGSTLAQPSSSELAALAGTVRESGVDAIFANVASSTVLVEALAQEIGREIAVVPLYVGSVGAEGSGAETYATMMTTDAQLIADALTGQAGR